MPVLAVVLLVGMVAVGSIGVFLLGNEVISSTSANAETDRVESGFVQLGQTADTISLSNHQSRQVDLDLEESATAVRREDTGRITVTASDREEPIVDRSIGSLEYRADDTVVAYQAGGVWRGTGAGTRMVSAPEVHYRHGSLTLPIVTVTGDERLSGDRIAVAKNRTISPLNDVGAVEGKLVTITVQSEYYAGWAEYFESRMGDAAVTVDHDTETVVVDLGRPSIDAEFEDAVVAQGSVQTAGGSACIDGTIVASGSVDAESCDGSDVGDGGDEVTHQPIDEAIATTVESARDSGAPIDGDAIGNGTYYGTDLVRTDDLTVNVSEGDVTIVVDGHVALDNSDLEVVGTHGSDGVVRVYATGDVAIGNGNGGVSVEDDDPGRFQVYGTSEMHVAIGQGSVTGTVYAPRDAPADGENEAAATYLPSSDNCDDVDGEAPDVCIGQGNVDVTGSIVAGPISVEQSSELAYDPALETAEPTLALDGIVLPPPLTHVQVVVHELEVSDP